MRLMDVIRSKLGGHRVVPPTMTPEQFKVWVEQQELADRLARLRRVDASIPVDRRYHFVPVHPRRREGD